MDLLQSLGTMLNWILYVGLALSVVLFIVSLLLASFGRWSSKLFFSALAGILLGSTATLIQRALVEGISLGDPYTLIAILVVSGFIVASVISFGLGNPERGSKYFLAAALAAGFFAAIPAIQALFGAQVITPTGACTLEAKPITQDTVSGLVTLEFAITYGKGTYDLLVYWGDGKSDRTTISAGGKTTLTHQYTEEGGYGIVAVARSNEGGMCTATLGINVKNKPFPWFSSMFDPTGASNIVNQLVSIPYQLFYTSPEFDTRSDSEDMKTYRMVTTIAISFIGIFIVLRFASGFFSKDPTESLIDSMKDAILVIIVILVAPFIYQIFVSMCNMVSLSAAYHADLGNPVGLSVVLGLIAASAALGVFSSFFGTFGGALAAMLMLASVTAVIRFALIKAIMYCIPLLAVAFLFPVARGATRFFINLLIGLILSGPVAAFVLVGMGALPGVGGVAKFLAPVIAMIAFPFVFTAVGGPGPLMAATPLARVGSGLLSTFAPRGGTASSATTAHSGGPGPDGGAGGATVSYSNVNNRTLSNTPSGDPGSSAAAGRSINVEQNSSNVNSRLSGGANSTQNPAQNLALQRFLGRPDYQEFLRGNQTPVNRTLANQTGNMTEQIQESPPPPSDQGGRPMEREVQTPDQTPDSSQQRGAQDMQDQNQDNSRPTSPDRIAENSSRAKKFGEKLMDARRSVISRYHALADHPRIQKLSMDFSRGSSLILGGRPGSSEVTRANIEAAKAKKEFYEARTRLLESIERDLYPEDSGRYESRTRENGESDRRNNSNR